MREDALEPVELPDEVWDRPDTARALRERRIGYLFGLAKKYAGASQTRIANVTGMDQSEISRITKGNRRISAIDVLERVARGLVMPDRARVQLGLAPAGWQDGPDAGPPTAAEPAASPEPAGPSQQAPVGRRLPAPLTELVGREADIGEVSRLLATRRLVTLVGAPGIGKTRLAVAVAEDARDQFVDGVAFISLAEAEGADRVVPTIARALELTDVPGEPLIETIAAHLEGRRTLLVLDNFEHVLDAAPAASRLVENTTDLRVLVTSRERLRISGEQVYSVPPLTLPDLRLLRSDGASATMLLASSSAMQLFADRASIVQASFTIDQGSVHQIAELCHRLDGLPLAIELAAARVGPFTPAELLDGIRERLSLLSEGPRDVPARQQTLEAAIAWSVGLLAREEQVLLARLSVFAGGCLAEAAQRVCVPEMPVDEVTRLLAALVEKNVVLARPDPEGRTRYSLLETIRVFGVTSLEASGGADEIHARHADDYYAAFVERARSELVGSTPGIWMGRVDREYPNIQAALTWTLSHGHVETAARIASGLKEYWWNGHDIAGGRRWYERILAEGDRVPATPRVQVLVAAAELACWQVDYPEATRLAQHGVAEAREAGETMLAADALNTLGLVAWGSGDFSEAAARWDECLALYREIGHARGVALTLTNLGGIAFRLGDLDAAGRQAVDALALFKEIGHRKGVALALENLGEVRLLQGDAVAARPLLTEALAICEEMGEEFLAVGALDCLGRLAGLTGDGFEQVRRHADALERCRDMGDQEYIAQSLEGLAAAALAQDSPDFAARLLAAAEALRCRLSLPLPPVYRPALDAQLDRVRAALPADGFAAEWAAGESAPIDEVVARALEWAWKAVAMAQSRMLAPRSE